jgi:hypothetical protein
MIVSIKQLVKLFMKKGLAVFLQVLVVMFGLGVLFFMLWEPNFEGRNAHATLFEVYFKDPFLAYAYASSVAFFVALFQVFKLLGLSGRGLLYSSYSVKSLQIIKRCSIILAILVFLPLLYLVIKRPDDDIAGGVFMGNLILLGSISTAVISSKLKKFMEKKMTGGRSGV